MDVNALNSMLGVEAPPSPFEAADNNISDKDTFLKLLTTQLTNQDPTNPMENEQFLAQLAQFSSLEQLMGIQATMQAVYTGIQAMNNSGMANLLGTEVTAVSDTFAVPEGIGDDFEKDLGWAASGPLSDARLTITDADGNVVRTISLGSVDAEDSYTWDGTDSSGEKVPEGTYTYKVTGTDADGNRVSAESRITGLVDGMDYSTGTPQPSVDGVPVSLSDLLTLRIGKSD